jgi:peptide/nickel transport system permease protein
MTALAGAWRILRRVCSTVTGAAGFGIVALVLVAALLAPWVATTDPDRLDVMNRFAAPSFAHLLGTDHLGRDLYSRLVHGATVAMSVALTSIAIALGLAICLHVAAYLQRAWRQPIGSTSSPLS